MQLGNVLAAQQQISLEARKSFALPFYFKVRDAAPTANAVDLTDCTITFVAATDAFSGGTTVINKTLEIVDAEDGRAQLNLQAADIDLPEGDYPYMVSLVTADGYSAAVLKGYVHVLDNSSPFKANVFETAISQSITLTLQQNNRVVVEIAAVDAGELSIGTVTTVSSIEDAAATITGVWPNQVLNLEIPRGEGAGDLTAEVEAREAADAALDARIDLIEGGYATDAELADEAAAARNASNLTSGTVPDARLSAAIARVVDMLAGDAAVSAAIAAHIADATAAHVASAIGFTPSVSLPFDNVQDAVEGAVNSGTPAGAVVSYAGSSAPTGWLLCNGDAVSRVTYADLFAVIGTTYGIGDGFTSFNLPNLKGKVPVGRDGADSQFDVLGETGGSKTHALSVAELPSHQHDINHKHPAVSTGIESANHYHNMTLIGSGTDDHDHVGGPYNGYPGSASDSGSEIQGYSFGTSYQSSNHTHVVDLPPLGATLSGAAGAGAAHNNLQPYITLNYIIKI